MDQKNQKLEAILSNAEKLSKSRSKEGVKKKLDELESNLMDNSRDLSESI